MHYCKYTPFRSGYLSQLAFGNHDWSWLITKNHHVKWNILHDFWWSNFMICGDLAWNVSFNMMTFHDIWWFLVTFDDYWWFFMIKTGNLSWLIMIHHDQLIMTTHHPIWRGWLLESCDSDSWNRYIAIGTFLMEKSLKARHMSFTPFVLRLFPVYCHRQFSIGVLFINSSTVFSSLHRNLLNGSQILQWDLDN